MASKGALVVCSLLVFYALVHGEAGHEKAQQEADDTGHGLEKREATYEAANGDGSAAEMEEGTDTERQRRSGVCRLLCQRICISL